MKLHRLVLTNYRGITHREIEFPDRGVVVVSGANEIGKTSMIEALDLLLHSKDRSTKKDVKQVRLSVEGADVQILKVVLGWDNRPDTTLNAVGTVKAGGQTAPTDAPGRKGRLTWTKIQYKILGKAPTATVKILGLD